MTVDASYIALALVPGIGRARLDALLRAFRTADAVLGAGFDRLRAVPGMNRAAATAVSEATSAAGERVMTLLDELGGDVLTPADPRFPNALRHIPDAPTMLFAKGRLDLVSQPAVAIVGSRTHTRYGAEVCRHMAGGLARAGLVVVSGMARGLDAIAHGAALDVDGGTVGVLGNGLGVVYPAANRALYDRVGERGCLLTEFPPGDRPHAGSFPRRNRLISGLARCTVVIEARARSGALITVDCALSQAREVLAVPGPITSPTSMGCNRLIQQGAKPALGLQDVLEEYGLSEASAASPVDRARLPAAEQRVIAAIEAGIGQVDDLAAHLECPVEEALSLLTSLELKGAVSQDSGKIFRPTLDAAVQTLG